MRVLVMLSKIVLGAIFLVHGLNVFLNFIPIAAPTEGVAGAFVAGLAGAGYFFPFLAIMEIICGGLLLLGKFVPLALTMLAPIVLHILAFHTFIAPPGLLAALVLVGLTIFLAVAYRDSFRELFRSDAQPTLGRGAPTRHMVEGRKERDHAPREPVEA